MLFLVGYKEIYFSHGSIIVAYKKGYRPSYAWSSIIHYGWVFHEGVMWKVGDGKSVNVWEG